MPHFDPTNTRRNMNAPKGIPDFDALFDAEIPAKPIEQPAPEPEKVPVSKQEDKPAAQPEIKTAPRAEPVVPATETAAEPKPRKRGRPAKSEQPAVKPAKLNGKKEGKEYTTVSFSPEVMRQLKLIKVIDGTAITDIVEAAASDRIYRTYECCEPECFCRFSMSVRLGENLKPVRCPVCNGQKLRHVKVEL